MRVPALLRHVPACIGILSETRICGFKGVECDSMTLDNVVEQYHRPRVDHEYLQKVHR